MYGALYENVAAQELAAHVFPLYYFKSKAAGEVDFVVECPATTVFPIQIKSGKAYKRHSALSRLLATESYGIDLGLVLCEGNVEQDGKVLYAPIYSLAFLEG